MLPRPALAPLQLMMMCMACLTFCIQPAATTGLSGRALANWNIQDCTSFSIPHTFSVSSAKKCP